MAVCITADTTLGRDALLVCDTTEMVDALNLRIHRERIHPEAPTMTVARGQQVAVGDVIISRRNDPLLAFHHSNPNAESLPPVRNGNRWRVAGIDSKRNLLGAERLDDGARVLFNPDYFREHVSLGYAVTVHSAQGVTADTGLAVLSNTTNRNLLYVAMTRGRHANHTHIYEHSTGASEFSHEQPADTHIAQRGGSRDAATLVYGILANDKPATTAHDYATQTADELLPQRVRDLLSRSRAATTGRRDNYRSWKSKTHEHGRTRHEAKVRQIATRQQRSADYRLEL